MSPARLFARFGQINAKYFEGIVLTIIARGGTGRRLVLNVFGVGGIPADTHFKRAKIKLIDIYGYGVKAERPWRQGHPRGVPFTPCCWNKKDSLTPQAHRYWPPRTLWLPCRVYSCTGRPGVGYSHAWQFQSWKCHSDHQGETGLPLARAEMNSTLTQTGEHDVPRMYHRSVHVDLIYTKWSADLELTLIMFVRYSPPPFWTSPPSCESMRCRALPG